MSYNPSSKTPISYYGGKQALLSHLLPLVPNHDLYTESYFGGGALFFAKRKSKVETINDRLDIVVNFYEQIQKNFPALKSLISRSLVSRTQHRRAQMIIRRRKDFPDVYVAWAFWMVTNFSFTNKIGGGIKYSNKQNACITEQMRNKKARFTEWLVNRIEEANIENTDALHVIRRANEKNAFHYIDPPYFNADMGHYNSGMVGAKDKWTEAKFVELLDLCEQLKGKFILSNYRSEVLDHYIEKNGWYKKEITKRLAAPMVKVKDKTEVIVLNYTPTDLLPTKLFD